MQKSRGSVTVFFALIFPLLLTLLFTLIEHARISGTRVLLRESMENSSASLFAGYVRPLFEDYGILGLDGGHSDGIADTEAMEETLTDFLWDNLSNGGFFLGGGSLFPTDIDAVTITEMVTAVDRQAEMFIRSAVKAWESENVLLPVEAWENLISVLQSGEETNAEASEKSKELIETDWTETDAETGEIVTEDATIKDALNDSSLHALDVLSTAPFLSLVWPEGTEVSEATISSGNLPSAYYDEKRADSYSYDLTMKALFTEYLESHFTSFGDDVAKEKQTSPVNRETKNRLSYQIEYLLFGRESDEENIGCAVNTLFLTRQGMDLLFLLSSEKRSEAKAAAALIPGVAANPLLLELVTAAFLLTWATGEALLDLRTLMAGKKLDLMKTEETWTLGFSGIETLLSGNGLSAKESANGMSYSDYLHAFLYAAPIACSAFRAMDLIQQDMQQYSPHFLMEAVVFSLTFRVTATAPELFTSLPLFRKKRTVRYGYPLSETGKRTY